MHAACRSTSLSHVLPNHTMSKTCSWLSQPRSTINVSDSPSVVCMPSLLLYKQTHTGTKGMEPEGVSQVLQRFSLYMPRSLTPADLWNLTCSDSMTVLPAPSVLASMTLNMSPSASMCAFTRLNLLQESRTPYGLYSSLSTLHLTVTSFGARLGTGGWLTLTR